MLSMPLSSIDWIFFLIGIGFGALYAVDGWWRTTTEGLYLRDTPRSKNLKWVISGAGVALMSEFTRFFGKFDFRSSFLYYLYGAMISAIIVILGLMAFILVRQTYLYRRGRSSIDPLGAAADYFVYGYTYYKQQEATMYRHFVADISKKAALTIVGLHAHLSDPSEHSRKVLLNGVLRTIRDILADHYRTRQDVEVNVNFMRAIPTADMTPELWRKVQFSWGDKGRFPYFLAIFDYAVPEGQEDFLLPVEDRHSPNVRERVLPGAPTAFVRRETVVIDDTSALKFAPQVPAEVQDGIRKYFNDRPNIASFASLVVVGEGGTVGIVNLDSNKPYVLGRSEVEQRELADLLSPFCSLAGLVLR